MEQEDLINEKRTWLFEQIKSEYAAMAKKNTTKNILIDFKFIILPP